MKHTLNAEGKKIGRIATEAAVLLMGKDRTDFKRNTIPAIKVEIVNASKADIDSKKSEQKNYKRYSGYPGGLKSRTLSQVAGKKGYGELFREAVSGMLPKNKLRSRMMNNLTVTE